jgi:hypothetical protein
MQVTRYRVGLTPLQWRIDPSIVKEVMVRRSANLSVMLIDCDRYQGI